MLTISRTGMCTAIEMTITSTSSSHQNVSISNNAHSTANMVDWLLSVSFIQAVLRAYLLVSVATV